jgi:hypothetical protein
MTSPTVASPSGVAIRDFNSELVFQRHDRFDHFQAGRPQIAFDPRSLSNLACLYSE